MARGCPNRIGGGEFFAAPPAVPWKRLALSRFGAQTSVMSSPVAAPPRRSVSRRWQAPLSYWLALGVLAASGVTSAVAVRADLAPPVITSAVQRDLGARIAGTVTGDPNTKYNVLLYAAPQCPDGIASSNLTALSFLEITTDDGGGASFSQVVTNALNDTQFVVARLLDNGGTTSALSVCAPVAIQLTYWQDVAVALETASAEAAVGEDFTYNIVLSNAGQGPTGPPTVENLEVEFTVPATAEFVSASDGGVFDNGVVRFSGVTVPAGGGPALSVTVFPDTSGDLTASVHVNDPGPYQANNTATLTIPIGATDTADLGLTLTAQPEPVRQGAELTYTLTVTNAGPAVAPGCLVTDTLPASVLFLGARASQGALTFTNGTVACDLGALTNGATATVTIRVQPSLEGPVTNAATVTLSGEGVADPSRTNDNVSVVSTVVPPLPIEVVTVPTLDPRTGLFVQVVRFTNVGTNPLPAIALLLDEVPTNVVVLNASGATAGKPYLQRRRAVAAGEGVNFTVEFYQRDRGGFASPVYTTVEDADFPPPPDGVDAPAVPGPGSLKITGRVDQGRFLLEFQTAPGNQYLVQYRDTLNDLWHTASPAITGATNVVQWSDDGPPQTANPSGALRFYRVIQFTQS